MVEAKGLYTAILSADPPAALAISIRDKKPFEKLSEPETVALFTVIARIRKAGLAAMEAAQSASSAAAESGNGGAAKPATGAPLTPEVISPEKGPKAPKKGGLTEASS